VLQAKTKFVCPREVLEEEDALLIDAFAANASLTYLDLTRSGLNWDCSDGARGTALLEQMAREPTMLGGLKTLVVREGCLIPVGELRAGAEPRLTPTIHLNNSHRSFTQP
jgi:hypothetical protein